MLQMLQCSGGDKVSQAASGKRSQNVLEEGGRYESVSRHKKGDMLCSPFQCDRCWFINLKNREPKQHQSDTRLMMYIRRVNLDMLRSRETSTVEKSLSQYNKVKGWANEMGIRMNMDQAIQTWPMGDNIGFGEALIILRYSLEKGNNSKTHCQFDTIRRIRTMSTNMYESSAKHGGGTLAMRAGVQCLNLSPCSTDSVLREKNGKYHDSRYRIVSANFARNIK